MNAKFATVATGSVMRMTRGTNTPEAAVDALIAFLEAGMIRHDVLAYRYAADYVEFHRDSFVAECDSTEYAAGVWVVHPNGARAEFSVGPVGARLGPVAEFGGGPLY